VAVSAVVIATPVVLFAGVTAVTVGAGGGGAAAVVKDQLSFALSAEPCELCAPVVMVAVYCVLYASALLGVNVATLLAYVTVPLTAPPPCAANVNVELVIVAAFIASLNVAVTVEFTATPVAALAGVVAVTSGGEVVIPPPPPLLEPPPPHPAIMSAEKIKTDSAARITTLHHLAR
jgi:hypothetical protein